MLDLGPLTALGFDNADEFWTSFQSHVAGFVNQHGAKDEIRRTLSERIESRLSPRKSAFEFEGSKERRNSFRHLHLPVKTETMLRTILLLIARLKEIL